MQNQTTISPDPATELAPLGPIDLACFRNNELLAGLSDKIYSQIAHKIHVIRYRPNEIIFKENEPGTALYLIAHGSVKISKQGRGAQQETLAYLKEQDFFGEMALVDGSRRSAQAAAVGDVILGRLDRSGWDLLLYLAPHEALNNFTRAVTKRLRHNNQHFIDEMMRNERLSLIGTTVSSIVHDMNNPISCILGACDVIRGTVQNDLTGKMTSLIREAVEKMEVMTRELIDFSRGNTQLHLQTITVPEFLRGLEPDLAKSRPGINVHIDVLYDGQIRVDRHRLVRVFSNLIRNAREAMKKPDGDILRLTVERIDDHVRFEVADSGCGIPVDLLPRIFEPFMTHGKSNGTGLGLAISRAVVEAHGGTITVESSERGTTFQVDLPLEA